MAPWLFIAPNAFGVALFVVFPLAFSLYMSFFEWDAFTDPSFVGLDNFRTLLFDDPLFWVAVRTTAVFTFLAVVPTVVISVVVAAALNQQLPGIGVYRTLMFIPAVASTVAVSVMWRWILSGDGVLNWGIGLVGLGPVGWLTDEDWALFSVALVSVWKAVGFNAIILLGAIKAVPEQLYEAAAIDGARPLRRFTSITLPMIRPALWFVVVIGIITSFQVFDQVYTLTNGLGGPGDATYVYGFALFRNAFNLFEFGYASAQALVLLVFLLALTYVQLRLSRRSTEAVYGPR